jgi:hypothetical protein
MCATCGCMGNMKKTMKKAVSKKAAPAKKAQQAAIAISKKSSMNRKKGM